MIQRPTVQPAFQHYRAYQPKPLTKQEIDQVEILFGGLHWRAERLIQATFENRGYKARPLPAANKADLLLGRELADIGQCCPTSFTTGNLANFLRGEADKSGLEHVTRKFAYVTAGSCGACRFGQYHQSYELALRNLGLEDFRLFLRDIFGHAFSSVDRCMPEINFCTLKAYLIKFTGSVGTIY